MNKTSKPWLTALMALGLSTAPALAQEEGAAPEDAAPPPAAEPAAAKAPAAGVYEVQPGDTLWIITQKQLQNPWYWPKVWADNPDITNPNWIEPGTRLVIKAPGEELPAEVSLKGPAPDLTPEDPAGEVAPGPEEVVEEGPIVVPEEESVVSLAGQIGFKSGSMITVRMDSFITPAQLAEAGVIHASFEEKEMLAWGDRIYIKFGDTATMRIGEEYMVYRGVKEIVHPITHQIVGYQSEILGSVRLDGKKDDLGVGTITQSSDVLERGHLVAPGSGKVTKQVSKRANSSSTDGYIVASRIPRLETLGEQQVVFLDRGAADKVEEGNTFMVTRRGDGLGGISQDKRIDDEALPPENIAELLVIDVKETTSSALVINSIREVEVGDKVTMRPAGSAGSGGD